MENSEKRNQFERDGFYVFQNILDAETVDSLNTLCDRILSEQDPEHFELHKTTGSMVLIDYLTAYQHRVMSDFITHPNVLGALTKLGFDDPKFGHGRIITKPPHSPPLFWHEDGRLWNDPVSYTTQPIQVFLMYYLVDTTPENGCLRVIPGSHLKRHPLHNQISENHTEDLRTYANPDDPGFSRVDDEIDVPVKAGDLVVGYGSLLHASHANDSDLRRTVLTMWYYPDYVNLPERTQATVATSEKLSPVPPVAEQIPELEALRIEYHGNAEPIEIEWVPKGLK